MSQEFDTTLKKLFEQFAPDWFGWLAPTLGLPAGTAVMSVDAHLPALRLEADKVFKLLAPGDGLVHIEPQANWDGTLPRRLHKYSSLLDERDEGPVYSVALLLRRDANARSITGRYQRAYPSGRVYDTFGYWVVRAWELSADDILEGGIGTLPLALLADDAEPRLGEVVDQVGERLAVAGADDITRRLVLTSGFLLSGLRYDEETIHHAFARAHGMKDSTTYQAILREGRQEGRQEGVVATRQEALLDILRDRFGAVPEAVEARVLATTDAAALKAAIPAALHVASPDDLTL